MTDQDSAVVPAQANDLKDRTAPEGRWAFDPEVTRVFEDMLRRSIPQYDVMREAVLDLGFRYRQHLTEIVDLGCSRGDALAEFIRLNGATNRYTACDVSEPMLAVARERFKPYIDAGICRVVNCDLRESFPPVANASVILSVLSLQFIPIEYRERIVSRAYQALAPGGAFILVEKVLGSSSDMQETLVSLYHAMKARNGYSREEIDRKRFALEGVLVPQTADRNVEMLKAEGFRDVECFWRWMNFAGWVAVKR